MYICSMYICMYVCMNVCIVCMDVHMYLCMYACMYVCICVCMYVCEGSSNIYIYIYAYIGAYGQANETDGDGIRGRTSGTCDGRQAIGIQERADSGSFRLPSNPRFRTGMYVCVCVYV